MSVKMYMGMCVVGVIKIQHYGCSFYKGASKVQVT